MKHLAAPAGRHRAPVRPRHGRMVVSGSAAVVTSIAVLGGVGVIPGTDARAESEESAPAANRGGGDTSEGLTTARSARDAAGATASARARAGTRAVPVAGGAGAAVPADSGTGTRIVFSESAQRVWLVDGSGESDRDRVVRSYLVSGSTLDNLDPGTYEVFSRSRHAVGIDDSGTMEYFVRFTHGTQGAAIGFHTIPVKDGEALQTRAELGTPLSHGCIRQARADAIALWDFAPLGTTVVVTA